MIFRRREAQRPIPVPVLEPALDVRAELAALRDEVTGRVTALAEQGSVDAGNGDVLDAWLERQRASWHARLAGAATATAAAVKSHTGAFESRAVETELAAAAAATAVAGTQRALDRVGGEIFRAKPEAGRERRRRPRPTSDPLEGIAVSRWSQFVLWLLLLLAATGDVVTFYIVLAGTFRDAPAVVVYGLTAAFAAAAIGLMHVVGRALRNLREGQGGLGRPTIAMTVLGWLTLGAVAVFFRSQVATPTTAAGSIFDADAGAEAAAAQEQLLSAVLLAGLFLASGLLAFYVGYSEHHPRIAAYRILGKQLAAQQRIQRDTAAAAVQAREALALAGTAEARVASWLADGSAQVDSTIDELKELVRVLVAQHMRLPEATNGLTTGRADAEIPVRRFVEWVPGPEAGAGTSHGPRAGAAVGAADLPLNGHASPNGHGPSGHAGRA